MSQPAALYARVSSDRQKENHTIASQVAALIQYAETHGYVVPPDWQFQDDGYRGATLVRPGLEALRDLAAEGYLQTILIYSPDRLSRKYAYQVLLAEELARCGVDLAPLERKGADPDVLVTCCNPECGAAAEYRLLASEVALHPIGVIFEQRVLGPISMGGDALEAGNINEGVVSGGVGPFGYWPDGLQLLGGVLETLVPAGMSLSASIPKP